MNEKVAKYYNQFHDDRLIHDIMHKNPRIEAIKGLIDDVFTKYSPRNVLEIGCSVGVTAKYMIEKGADVVGIDISDRNIDYCRKNIHSGEFLCGDFLENDIIVGYAFDLICCFDTLEHIEKYRHGEFFERVGRLSNSNTKVMITVPDPFFLDYYRRKYPDKLQIIDESIYPQDMMRHFEKNDMEILIFVVYGIDFKRQYNYYLSGFNHPYKLTRK